MDVDIHCLGVHYDAGRRFFLRRHAEEGKLPIDARSDYHHHWIGDSDLGRVRIQPGLRLPREQLKALPLEIEI